METNNFSIYSDEHFMMQALKEATKALDENEVPVGALLVIENQVVGKGYNMVEQMNDSTAHAEMIALTSAMENQKSKYLRKATLYCTLEPCLMCFGAIQHAQISRLIYGAEDKKKGFSLSTFPQKTHIVVQKGVKKNECSDILNYFFQKLREKK